MVISNYKMSNLNKNGILFRRLKNLRVQRNFLDKKYLFKEKKKSRKTIKIKLIFTKAILIAVGLLSLIIVHIKFCNVFKKLKIN